MSLVALHVAKLFHRHSKTRSKNSGLLEVFSTAFVRPLCG